MGWKELLKRIWGDSVGWSHVSFKVGGDWKNRAYQYPGQLGLLVKELEDMNAWADVYFCPHLLSSGKSRKKEYAEPLRALWVDKDSGKFDDLQPRPTICWETSQGRYQAVWLLDEPTDPLLAEKTNKHLTRTCGADKGGWHLGKVLRAPGSINYKYSPPEEGQILWDDGPIYNVLDLLPSTEEIEQQKEADAEKQQILPNKIPSMSDALVAYGRRIPKAAWDLLGQSPEEGAELSDNLWRLERLLAEVGIDPKYIYAIVEGSPWNKYKRDDRPPEQLWQEILRAKEDKTPVEKVQEDLPWMTLDDLLLHAEEPTWLIEGIWMAKNVGWIAGVGKSYKSVISLDLALSVATGTPFLGIYPVIEQGPVLMVQEEDPLWRVAKRLQVMADAKGLENIVVAQEEDGAVFRVENTLAPLHLSVGGGFIFTEEEKVSALERAIDRHRPRLVVIDPMYMVSAGIDEFKAGEITGVLLRMKEWRNKYDCAVAVVHHYRKGTGEDVDRLYGSMALYAWSENNLLVSRRKSGNTSVITTDIKDAPSTNKIIVDFVDIKDRYEIMIAEEEERDSSALQIKSFLRSGNVGSTYSVKDIISATGVSDKTVRAHLKALEDTGNITLEVEGRGGRLHVTPLARLMASEEVEDVVFE